MSYKVKCRILKEAKELSSCIIYKSLEQVDTAINIAKLKGYDIQLYYANNILQTFNIFQPLDKNKFRVYDGVLEK